MAETLTNEEPDIDEIIGSDSFIAPAVAKYMRLNEAELETEFAAVQEPPAEEFKEPGTKILFLGTAALGATMVAAGYAYGRHWQSSRAA